MLEKLSRQEGLQGVRAAFPVAIAYLPLGGAFGLLAANSNLSFAETLTMSLLVYTGAAQFFAATMLAAGESIFAIGLMTLVVNSRYVLYGVVTSGLLSDWSFRRRFLLSLQLTDEVFALHSVNLRKPGPYSFSKALGINLTVHASWLLASTLGYCCGEWIGDGKGFGFDFVMPAIFIALLALAVQSTATFAVCITSGIAALVFSVAGHSGIGLIVATIFGALVGALLQRQSERKNRHSTRLPFDGQAEPLTLGR